MKTVGGNLLMFLVMLVHLIGSVKGLSDYSGSTFESVSILVPSVNSRAGPYSIRFAAFNRTWSLRLKRNSHLLSSKFAVERRRGGNETVKGTDVDGSCYYSGTVDGEPFSKVAVATCNGLTGFVRIENEELAIRPRNGVNRLMSTTEGRWFMHVLYRTVYRARGNEKIDDQTLGENTHKADDYSSPGKSSKSIPDLNQLQGFASSTVFIETLLVADKSMLQRYGSDNLPIYALATMNEAASLFQSKSIGMNIHLVVTHLVVLESDHRDLKKGKRADRMLFNFCRWKNNLDDLPLHDVAVFLTRKSICVDHYNSCDAYGLAFTGGMCNPNQSCTIIQDDGIRLAYTIAHEIGHTLGMIHDEDAGCRYKRRRRNLMTSSLSTSMGALSWSPCSERALSTFVRSDKASCLYNKPVKLGVVRPSVSAQSLLYMCQGVGGSRARVCNTQAAKKNDSVCSGVWCKISDNDPCVYVPGSRLDRVSCGHQQVCMNSECVVGGWSAWTGYSLCSSSCGQGVQYRERHCLGDNHACIGSSRQYQLCHTQLCPLGSEDARTSRCASFNDKLFRDGRYYNWIPYISQDSTTECRLTCKPDMARFYALLGPSVPDGTSCASKENGVCVGGTCRMVGCDNVLESPALRDRCGVCVGDGTSCSIIASTFRRNNLTYYGYHKVIRLPVGSMRINVTEMSDSHNYLAVRSGQNSAHYYINGDWTISQPGVYPAAGTVIMYRRFEKSSEMLWITGPIKEDLVIMVLSQSRHANVSYQYQINKNASSFQSRLAGDRFRWRYTRWSNCSQQCAGGVQTRQLVCHDTKTGNDVQLRRCMLPPVTLVLSRPCNVQPCSPRWTVGPWSPGSCSVTCGGGLRRRQVQCAIQVAPKEFQHVKNRLCDRQRKPSNKETCNARPCPLGSWLVAGVWSPCSVSCGEGQQNREILCKATYSRATLPFSECDLPSRPVETMSCTMPGCPAASSTCKDIVPACKRLKTDMCKRQAYYQRMCCDSCRKFAESLSRRAT